MAEFPWEIILAAAGALVPILFGLWEFVFVGRKRLGYRVQVDTTATNVSGLYSGAWQRLEREDGTRLVDPSFVLLRIENIGTTNIGQDDYAFPETTPVGISIKFPGRRVAGIVVTEFSDPTLATFFEEKDGKQAPGLGMRDTSEGGQTVGVVELPKVKLNRSDLYKVLVVLERDSEGHNNEFERPEVIATISGGVGAGKIRRTEGRTGTPRWVIALICSLVFVSLAEPVLFRLLDEDIPLDCASGELTLTGSTAFAPVLEEAARSYENVCPDADVTFDFRGSTEGLRALDTAGRNSPESPAMLAFTDGAKTDAYPRLLPRPIAFSLFTLVINKDAGVNDLTPEQIRQIYDGQITNWQQLNGNNQPASLVSRNPGSGTRKTFQQQILGGKWEPGSNSDDCRKVDPGAQSGVIRCERSSTGEVLAEVARVPGTLGYSELGAAAGREDLVRLRIGGHEANLEGAVHAAYPYWETEYAYTSGEPKADSVTAGFLRYLTKEVGIDIVRSHGHRPCVELENPVLCRPE